MIKTLIKHIITETAIDAFFSNLTKNFNNMNLNKKCFVGQRFNRIVTEDLGHTDHIRITIYNATVIVSDNNHFTIKNDRPVVRENLSDGTSQYMYHTGFYDDIKYIE